MMTDMRSVDPRTEWEGRRIVITGGAHGIGEAVARRASSLGARVAIADFDEAGAAALVADLRAGGPEALSVFTDVTDSKSIDELFAGVTAEWGGVDTLVNCAGGFSRRMGFEEISDQEWQKVLQLNAFSAFACCRAVLPQMRRSHYGRIVNVSSEAGRMPIALSAAHYAAAKAAILGLTRHLAREVAADGVCVNAVAPGTTLSERVKQFTTEESAKTLIAITPLGRLANLEDQVEPILFLASDGAAYITGATLDVNGGRFMM
jgi:NAD(P)-dependent dehydrogenase (short-subunit alcohol dehydrogenase family)